MLKKVKNIAVYTALFGSYDYLRDPPVAYNEVDYLCFTDNKKFQSKKWKVLYIKKDNFSPKDMNRYIKINNYKFLKDYKFSIYHDANVVFFSNPIELVKKYLKSSDIAMLQHRYRNSSQAEVKEVLAYSNLSNLQNDKVKKITKKNINWLTENRFILRRNNKKIIKDLMKTWWKMYKNGIVRDQISFPYACKMHGLKPNIIKKKFHYLHIFTVKPHTKSSLRFKIKYYFFIIFIELVLIIFFKIKNYAKI